MKRIQHEDVSKYKPNVLLKYDRYLLLNLLGKGGFSEVYKAYDLHEMMMVAIKIHQLNQDWTEQKKSDYQRWVKWAEKYLLIFFLRYTDTPNEKLKFKSQSNMQKSFVYTTFSTLTLTRELYDSFSVFKISKVLHGTRVLRGQRPRSLFEATEQESNLRGRSEDNHHANCSRFTFLLFLRNW